MPCSRRPLFCVGDDGLLPGPTFCRNFFWLTLPTLMERAELPRVWHVVVVVVVCGGARDVKVVPH